MPGEEIAAQAATPFINTLGGQAAIGGGAGILGDFLNYKLSKKAQKRQFEMSKQLMDYQFDKNLQMWNLQNEYNSPASQMQRYQEAGLNPNLVAGQGNSGNASSYPEYQAPDVSKAQLRFDNFINNISRIAAVVNTNKNTEKTQAEIDTEKIKAQNAAAVYNEYVANRAFRDQIKDGQLKMLASDLAMAKVKEEGLNLSNEAAKQRFHFLEQEYLLELGMKNIDFRVKQATEDSVINRIIADSKIAGNQAEASKYFSDQAMANLANSWSDYRASIVRNKTMEYARDTARVKSDEAKWQENFRIRHMKELEDKMLRDAGYNSRGELTGKSLVRNPTDFGGYIDALDEFIYSLF